MDSNLHEWYVYIWADNLNNVMRPKWWISNRNNQKGARNENINWSIMKNCLKFLNYKEVLSYVSASRFHYEVGEKYAISYYPTFDCHF